MGVSSILELGEAFAHDKPAPQRSIAIVCWTLEEQGLLGSEYFAKHPVWPLNHIVGGGTWADYDVDEGRERALTRRIADGSPKLWEAAEAVFADAVRNGWLKPIPG